MRVHQGRRIIDAFLAFDELELVRLRIEYLSEVVGITYVAESKFTFSGKPKPLFFRQNFSEDFLNLGHVRLLEVPISEDLVTRGTAWEVEAFHRQWLQEYLASEHPEDLVVISDADEVPSSEQLLRGREVCGLLSCVSLPMKTVVRAGNWRERPFSKPLIKAKMLLGKNLTGYSRESLCLPALGPMGTHFSYVGTDPLKLEKKYSSFSHIELNSSRFSSQEILDFTRKEMIHHVGRAEKLGAGVLVKEPMKHLNAFQQLALERQPDWFDFRSPCPGWIHQVRASQALTDFLFRNQELPDSELLWSGAWRVKTLFRHGLSRVRWLAQSIWAFLKKLFGQKSYRDA